jgi:hypothetical protein
MDVSRFAAITAATAFLVALAVLPACGDGGTKEITTKRTVSQPQTPSHPESTSTAERMGLRPIAPATSSTGFSWDAPETWQALPPQQFRPANFRAGAQGDVECYLSVLGGTGGGIAANVNRWRGQMGLEPLDEAAIEQLPSIAMLGSEALLVELEGAFGGMSGENAQEDANLLGAMLIDDGQAIFVKMTGPAASVAAERDQFLAFCASLKHGTTQTADASDPHAGLDLSNIEHPPGSEAESEYAWDAPEGWTQGPPRMMREATFTVGGVECYMAKLSGVAGGMEANINRWRGQMQQPPLEAKDIAALETVDMLGLPAKMVEVTGDFQGMSGESQSGAALVGAICPLEGSTLFVKMTGPAAEVQAQRDSFIAFCESVRPR